ncbi:MAG: hypothetical protein HC893_14560 [Chloroflexaceae bacterium]|nr:hypothetical protein [Chloroflexaceae bacterium]
MVLLMGNEQGTEVLVRPEVRRSLTLWLTPDERQSWHRKAADYWKTRQHYLEAAHHLSLAGFVEQAARLVLEQQQAILDQGPVDELREVLADLSRTRPNDLALWAELKTFAGEVAEFVGDIDAALRDYRQAVGSQAAQPATYALYRLARLLRLKNIDEALVYYDRCVERLLDSEGDTPLLVQVLIDRAWIFIEERCDLQRAEQDLAQRGPALTATIALYGPTCTRRWGSCRIARAI